MKTINPNITSSRPGWDGLPEPDVWWGPDGIDAMISPKPYVFWQSEGAAQPDMAAASKGAQ
jgi:hypothetical protein